jgi:hypothetical protein
MFLRTELDTSKGRTVVRAEDTKFQPNFKVLLYNTTSYKVNTFQATPPPYSLKAGTSASFSGGHEF